MLGNMIAKIRKDKNITKVELAKRTKINIGHLTHIEKGERNPSHKALRNICKSLNVPYQTLAYMYDKEISQDDKRYKLTNHISYNRVVAVNDISSFMECPPTIPNASMAFRITDTSMEPKLKENSYAFLELNVPLENRNFGLFEFNGELLVRRFIIRQDALVLRAENKDYPEILLSENDDFTIIGKVIPNSD